jgi:hypothetical protein
MKGELSLEILIQRSWYIMVLKYGWLLPLLLSLAETRSFVGLHSMGGLGMSVWHRTTQEIQMGKWAAVGHLSAETWKGLGYACEVQKPQKMTDVLRKLFFKWPPAVRQAFWAGLFQAHYSFPPDLLHSCCPICWYNVTVSPSTET